MPKSLKFEHLVERFGEVVAWHYLTEIERAARLEPQRSIPDPETRLANAIRAQEAMFQSALPMAA